MKRFDPEDIKQMAQLLEEGGILAYPTDTVYGLCVRFDSEEAKDALRSCKNRPEEKSFPIMVSDLAMMEKVSVMKDEEKRVAQAFMPGPLTLILDRSEVIEPWMNEGKDTISVRMASDEYLKQVIEYLEVPVYMTSANRSGAPVLETADDIEKYLQVDGICIGRPGKGVASTIARYEDGWKVLREGPLSLEEIERKR